MLGVRVKDFSRSCRGVFMEWKYSLTRNMLYGRIDGAGCCQLEHEDDGLEDIF